MFMFQDKLHAQQSLCTKIDSKFKKAYKTINEHVEAGKRSFTIELIPTKTLQKYINKYIAPGMCSQQQLVQVMLSETTVGQYMLMYNNMGYATKLGVSEYPNVESGSSEYRLELRCVRACE